MHQKRICIVVLTLGVLAMLLAGCGVRKPIVSTKPILTVSIEPLRYFVEAIVGEHYAVVTLVPPGSSPETYEPTPDKLVSMHEAKAYIRVGMLPFEQTFLRRMAEALPQLPTLDAAEGVAYVVDHHHTHHHAGHEHAHAEYDLHVWTSPSNARIIAQNIARFVQQLDTARAAYYQHRLDSLLTHIDDVDAQVRQRLKGVKHRTFGIYHPALAYYAKAYGLRQLAVEDGGREPSVARMAELINACQRDSVRVIFVQREFPLGKVTTLAKEIGARTEVINPLSAAWDEEMLRIAGFLQQDTP
ncbi:MAG: zinc ABC transporter substrate-binding protein [Bacteroidales bacterium]|nr:zinc ABC transporter substrate-binding protein [Bacteroidales bacterium]